LAGHANSRELAGVHYQIAAEIVRQIANPIADPHLRQTFLNAEAVATVLENSSGGWGQLAQG
jgi:hypothetical protein